MGNVNKAIGAAWVGAVMMMGTAAQAAVDYPRFDVQSVAGVDSAITAAGTSLTIDATVIALILNAESDFVTLDGDFALSAQYAYADNAYRYHYSNGTLRVGEIGSELLTAVFSDLVVTASPSGNGTFAADLIYTGGSLFTDAVDATGRGEGAVGGLSTYLLADGFTSSAVVMKIGDVSPVPVPAAVWLLGSGLVALAGMGRRRAR